MTTTQASDSTKSTATLNYFAELNKVNCAEHVEKKNGFSYLSWPFAIAELRKRHPSATWEVCRFEGMPFLTTPCGVFVEVAVTVEGVRLSQIHPVLDHRNKPIATPSAFEINTSIQRCLVKAIALHGLGLFIYAGEDLPESDNSAAKAPHKPVTVDVWDSLDADAQKWLQGIADGVRAELEKKGPAAALAVLKEQGLDADHSVALWSRFDSKERSSMKAASKPSAPVDRLQS